MSEDAVIERVWLLRHGQVADNLHDPTLRITAGQYNRMIEESGGAPLTAEGRIQIEALVAHFRDRPLPAVHTSPLLRARQSAEIIAGPLDLPVVVIEGFREMVPARACPHLLPGRRRTIRHWFLRSMARQFLPLSRGGETVWKARRRVLAAWHELLAWQPEGDAPAAMSERLVTTHRGTAMLLRSVLRRDPDWKIARWSIENGGITEIVRR